MLGHLGETLNAALAILAIATLAGLGLMRGTVTNLRENLNDARGEITDKERRLATAEAEIARLNSKIMTQAQGIETLGAQIRGEGYWIRLGNELAEHHTEAVRHWEADERLLTELRTAIDALSERMGKPPDERT